MPVSGSNGYRSGIVTLPNRIRLREMDSRLGMYPKIKRTGDKDRMGNDKVIPFDDKETILFESGVSNLLFGSLVTSGSSQSLLPYAGNNNPINGISGKGNVIVGISDSFYMSDYKELASRKNDNETLSFFDDSRINLSDTPFYMTGTLTSEYSNFSSRLHDKTQLVIDISSNEQSSVGLLNTVDNASLARNDKSDVKNQLMAYYNFKNKRWEKIARGVNGNVSSGTLGSLQNMVETAAIGFTNVGQISTGSSYGVAETLVDDGALAHYARPTKTFGFPFHAKYVATGSQVLKMSNYISSPFLVEKINFQFDEMKFENGDDVHSGLQAQMGFGRTGANSAPRYFYALGMSIHSFFLLRQTRKKENISVTINSGRRSFEPILTASTYTANIPGNAYLKPRAIAGSDTNEILTNVTSSRELITYSQLTTYMSASVNNQSMQHVSFDTIMASSLFRDASLRLSPKNATSTSQILGAELTSSLLIEAPVRVTPKTPLVNALIVSCSDATDANMYHGLYLDDEFGSRGSGNLDVNSRALFNGHASFKKGSSFTLGSADGVSGANQIETFDSADVDTLDENSPYILFPEDEIIIGYQAPLPRDLAQSFPENDATKRTKVVFEGPAKLVLFGSQIKNKQEFHDTLNQPLTSEAVHESLHYDNPVLDQYDINSRSEYSGSYMDNYRDPELKISNDSSITTDSIIGGTENQYPTSVQRFNRHSNNHEVFYDTMVPDPRKLWELQTGLSPFLSSSGETVLSFGVSGSNTQNKELINILGNANAKWFRSTIYDNSLGRVTFGSQIKNLANTSLYLNDGMLHSSSNGNGKDQLVKAFDKFNFLQAPGTTITGIPVLGDQNIKKQVQNYLMWLYGFGTGLTGSLEGVNATGVDTYTVKQRPRGFKYGIMSTNELFRSNIFRYDKFGQVADMLEQSIDSLTYDTLTKTKKQPPVLIKFVTEENDDTYKILDKSSIFSNTFASSNIDLAASSSIPFIDDGISRNRGIKTDTTQTQTTEKSTITVVRDDIS